MRPSTRAATGSSMSACANVSSRQSARSASLPGSSEPRSADRPRHRGAAERGHLEGVADRERLRAAGGPGEQQGVARLLEHARRLVARGAVDAEPDPGAGVAQVADAGDARAETAVGGRAVRHPGAGGADPDDRRRRRGARRARTRRRVRASPGSPCSPPASSRSARGSTSPRPGSRRGGCAAARSRRRASAAASRSRSAVTENGEQGATATRSIESGRRVVPAVDGRLGGEQHRVEVLHHVVGRQPALALAQVHRAAGRVEAQAHRCGPPRPRRRARRRPRGGRRSGGRCWSCSRCGPATPGRPARRR